MMNKNFSNIELFIGKGDIFWMLFLPCFCYWHFYEPKTDLLNFPILFDIIRNNFIFFIFILFAFIFLLIFNKLNTRKRLKNISKHIEDGEHIVKIKERIGIETYNFITWILLPPFYFLCTSSTSIIILFVFYILSMKIASASDSRVFIITNKKLFYITNDNRKIYKSNIFRGDYVNDEAIYYSDILDIKEHLREYKIITTKGCFYGLSIQGYPINKKDLEIIKALWIEYTDNDVKSRWLKTLINYNDVQKYKDYNINKNEKVENNKSFLGFFIVFICVSALLFGCGFYAAFCYGFSEKEYILNLSCDNTQYCIYNKCDIWGRNTTSQKIYLSDIYKLEKEYHSGGGYRTPKLGQHSYNVYMYNNNIINLRSNKLLENLQGYHSYVLMKKDDIYNNSPIIKEIRKLNLEKNNIKNSNKYKIQDTYYQLELKYGRGLNISDLDYRLILSQLWCIPFMIFTGSMASVMILLLINFFGIACSERLMKICTAFGIFGFVVMGLIYLIGFLLQLVNLI